MEFVKFAKKGILLMEGFALPVLKDVILVFLLDGVIDARMGFHLVVENA
jgi:hypothetical protein